MQASERTFGSARIAQFAIPAFVAGLAALAVACPASAADPSDQNGVTRVSERVVYRDLDLSTPQGAHALLHRVRAAAQNLCSPSGPRLTAGPGAEELRCRDQATARAIAQFSSPVVFAEYAKQTGRASDH